MPRSSITLHGIAKPDVDLHRNARSGQIGQELDTDAIVLVILFYFCALYRCAVEYKAVFFANLADCPDCLFNLADSG